MQPVLELVTFYAVDELDGNVMKNLIIYDTTLRDGEQAPGYSMSVDEKVLFAYQLLKLGVDVIEAGFPAASNGEFLAVRKISRIADDVKVAALCRARKDDIERAIDALAEAKYPRLNIVVPSSGLLIHNQLDISEEALIEHVSKLVRWSARSGMEIQASLVDATRADRSFVVELTRHLVAAGADVINFSDTFGFSEPFEFHSLITYIKEQVPEIRKKTVSVHCHNDLGLALANTLAALKADVDQVICTVNGIGERAGNVALEELVMTLQLKGEQYGYCTNVNSREIMQSSMLLCDITDKSLHLHKPIVGFNAFTHGAGTLQKSIIKEKTSCQLFAPEHVGALGSNIFIGKHSGRHAIVVRARQLGFDISEDMASLILAKVKEFCDEYKLLTDDQLAKLIRQCTTHFCENAMHI